MFDKTIKVEINRVRHVLTNDEVKALIRNQQDYAALEAKHDEMRRERDALQERLDAANAKLHSYGHMSGF